MRLGFPPDEGAWFSRWGPSAAEEAVEGFWVSGDDCGAVVGGEDGALDQDGVGDQGLDPVGAVGVVLGERRHGFSCRFVEAGDVPGLQIEASQDCF